MTHNLALGGDAHVNHALTTLRGMTLSQKITHDSVLSPGIRLAFAQDARVSGTVSSPSGHILDLDVQVETAGSWAAVHMDLGPARLPADGVVGLMCRTRAGGYDIVQPCVRSGTTTGFVDCFFGKQILSQPDERLHLDVLDIGRTPDLPLEAPWREIIFFLPTHRLAWTLLDLRVFIL